MTDPKNWNKLRYEGFIQKSRTLDHALFSHIVDVVLVTFLAYKPEQLGIALPVYFGIRIVLVILQAYLRYKTTGPVGEK